MIEAQRGDINNNPECRFTMCAVLKIAYGTDKLTSLHQRNQVKIYSIYSCNARFATNIRIDVISGGYFNCIYCFICLVMVCYTR